MKEKNIKRAQIQNLRVAMSIGGKSCQKRVLSFFSFIPHPLSFILLGILITSFAFLVLAQSGRNPSSGKRTQVIQVIAQKVEDPNKPKSLLSPSSNLTEDPERIIPKHLLELYDGGVLQKIESFSIDPTPARFVVLLDN